MKTKIKKHDTKILIVSSFLASLVMIASFSFVYWNTASHSPYSISERCKNAKETPKYSRAADGVVTVYEADLSCGYEYHKLREGQSAMKKSDLVGKIAAATSSVANVILLTLLYRRVGQLKK